MEKKATILTVEDNESDFCLLKKALKNLKNVDLEIINILNGQDALDFVYKRGIFAKSSTPDIIILDLDLPLVSGYEVLDDLKSHQIHRTIPIIIFSTSENSCDIQTCYKMHANSYITKSFNTKKLFKKIASLGEYWLETNKLPT